MLKFCWSTLLLCLEMLVNNDSLLDFLDNKCH